MAGAGPKSEEPTEHRLAEARRRGVLPISRDFQSGLTVLAVCLALILGGRTWLAGFLAYLRGALSQACSRGDLELASRSSLNAFIETLELPMGVAFSVTLIGGLVQSRGLFSSYAFRFDDKRILPSFRHGRRGEMGIRCVKTFGSWAIIIMVAWWTVRPGLSGLTRLAGAPAGRILEVLSSLAGNLGLRLGVAAIAMGLADLFWQKYRYLRSLRMSRDEVRRELKEREGDPVLKAARRQLRLEVFQQHSMHELRTASVVVVGYPGSAVALLYDPAHSQAPVVIGKGERLMARKIEQIASETGIPVFRDEALLAVLTKVDEGSEIPESTHEAVAHLLMAGRATPPRDGSPVKRA